MSLASSTAREQVLQGRIEAVTIEPRRLPLNADHTAGATTLSVTVTRAIFDEAGGLCLLNGAVYTYAAYDDETGILTGLSPAVAVDAAEGDWVNDYDLLYGAIETDLTALVRLPGGIDNEDPLPASFAQHLVEEIGDGIRGLPGEQCLLEVKGDLWRIVDILGLANRSGTGQASGGVLAEQDQTIVTTAGVPTQSIILKHTPILNSEHNYWNGDYQPGSEWTRYGNIIVFPDPDGLIKVGDELTCEYLYTPGTDFSDPGSGIELVGTVFYDLDVATNPGTGFDLALPSGTREGDMLCLWISSWVEPVSTADPRFYLSQLVTDDVVAGGDFTPSRATFTAVGREDGTGSTIHVEMGESGWRGVGIVAFRDPRVVSATSFFEVGAAGSGIVPPSPATRYIAVTGTISGTVADNIHAPALPAGAWVEALRDGSGKASGMVCYTPDPAPEVAALAAGIEFAAGVGGSTGYCQWIVLGVR